jgi:LysM repeat protein
VKYVLSIGAIISAFILIGCSKGALPEPSPIPATATLRPFPSSTQTPSQLAPYAQVTQLVPSEPSATPFVHVVREGDTLLSIALRYGVGLEELVLVNPGIDPQFLSVGTPLRIPGPEGEAVDVLLPTPTPVPIEHSEVRCFEALTGEFRCLSTILNDLPVSVEAVSGIIGLYDAQGNLLIQKSTESTLQFVPPGKTLPLTAVFPHKPLEYEIAELQVLSAIQAESDVSRFVPVDLGAIDWDEIENGAGALVDINIDIPSDLETGDYSLRVLGIGADEAGLIVGYRLVEQVVDVEATPSVELDFYLLSLGPPIQDVDVVAELLRID